MPPRHAENLKEPQRLGVVELVVAEHGLHIDPRVEQRTERLEVHVLEAVSQAAVVDEIARMYDQPVRAASVRLRHPSGHPHRVAPSGAVVTHHGEAQPILALWPGIGFERDVGRRAGKEILPFGQVAPDHRSRDQPAERDDGDQHDDADTPARHTVPTPITAPVLGGHRAAGDVFAHQPSRHVLLGPDRSISRSMRNGVCGGL